jgi:hypothetical protein
MGKPVIVTASTWMEAELGKLDPDCGIAADHSGKEFAEAMLGLENRLDQFAAHVAALALKIRSLHNAKISCVYSLPEVL